MNFIWLVARAARRGSARRGSAGERASETGRKLLRAQGAQEI